MYVCMYVCIYIFIYAYVYLQSKAPPTVFFVIFLSQIHKIEQCFSSPFVFVYTKIQRTAQALIEI